MPNDSVQQVLVKADAARALLTKQEVDLQGEINAIDDIEWDRPLTAEERSRRQQRRSAQTAVRAAKIELSFITLRALDQSPEVQRLINAFRSINQDLKQELDQLKSIAGYAETAAKVIDAMTEIAIDLAKVLVKA